MKPTTIAAALAVLAGCQVQTPPTSPADAATRDQVNQLSQQIDQLQAQLDAREGDGREAPQDPAAAPPTVAQPLVDGLYQVKSGPRDNGEVFSDKHLRFSAKTVDYRYRWLAEPEGDLAESEFLACDVTVSVPVQWTELGFTIPVAAKGSARVLRLDRTELPKSKDGRRHSNHSRSELTCSITLPKGHYEVLSRSDTLMMGRPASIEIRWPAGDVRRPLAVSSIDETYTKPADDHFWGR